MRNNRCRARNGAALVLFVVSLVTILTFVALAVDLGMFAVARTQCQDAADAAAMAGTATLNGITANNNNYSNAAPNAILAATSNSVLSAPIPSSHVAVQVGRYVYVSGNQRFEGQFPGPSTENWSMVQATVTANLANQLAFSRVFNLTSANVQAVATAVHRPRDVALILDYSGSMRFASLTGLSSTAGSEYTGTRTKSNNPDTVVPAFGHYAGNTSKLVASTFTSPYDAANITTTTSDGRAAVVQDFYQDAGGTPAFVAASSAYATTPDPAGDNFLGLNKTVTAPYAKTVKDITGATTKDATFDSALATGGYAGVTGKAFKGYIRGPAYWGKTFFVWPPDPNPAKDWRVIYFGVNDNTKLWNASGVWLKPSGTSYTINYTPFLNFIKNVGPNSFPTRLQSGRILYYDAIPNSINTATFPPTDKNERFWKEYIDYILGVKQTASNTWSVITGQTGYGDDFTSGTVQISAKPSGADTRYMNYLDNPKRPITHFWFGPLSMVDFLGNYNSNQFWWPGTCHESPLYACKLGIRAALTDISNNHPNNLVSLMMFSVPCASANDGNRFNRVRVGLGRDYPSMQDSLWYPTSTIGNAGATIRPYDTDNLEVPRATGGTCYSMALMQAYNQFSANTSLLNYNPAKPPGDAGGNGRKGAQKIVVLETDGVPNTTASATLNNLGPYNSYYSIRYNSSSPGSSEFPNVNNGNTVTTEIYNLCTQLCALDSASPPGYSTPSKKVLIHCIGFGPVFAAGAPGQAAALAILNQIQTIGNVTDGMPSYKVIYGSESTVTSSLQTAFTRIMQTGVHVSLVQ